MAMMFSFPMAVLADTNAKVGTSPSTTVVPLGASTGAATIDLRADPDGILRIGEEYPPQIQHGQFPAADTTNILYNGFFRQLGLGWSVSPFGNRVAVLTRVQSKDTRTLKIWLFGSHDNIVWAPVYRSSAWSHLIADSTLADTLGITIPPTRQNANTVAMIRLPLPEIDYPGRYLSFFATTLDSTVSTSYQKVGVTFEGRWK
jgi:hypothetical protein